MTAGTASLASRFHVERSTRSSRIAAIVGLILLAGLASLPAWGSSGLMRLLVEFFALLALAQMWNLLAGFAGLVSIGQQAYVGIGAYGLYLCADLLHLPPVPAIAVMAAGVVAIALFTSMFAFRLRDGYFAVGTWVIAEVIRLLVSQVRELGAGTGVTIQSLVAMPAIERLALSYWLALGVGFGSVVVAALMMRSRLGLALRAIRDSEISARGLGVDVARTKRIVYVVASVGCAIAGAVFYLQLLRIQPSAAFGVDWTAKIIFIVVIGGLGRIEGPIVGAILFFALQETLADQGSLYLVILGVTAIAITLLAPNGLWGLFTKRFPIALFGIERRLVLDSPDRAAPTGVVAATKDGQ
jgi:branched-chain amino acid transport system permease protein